MFVLLIVDCGLAVVVVVVDWLVLYGAVSVFGFLLLLFGFAMWCWVYVWRLVFVYWCWWFIGLTLRARYGFCCY